MKIIPVWKDLKTNQIQNKKEITSFKRRLIRSMSLQKERGVDKGNNAISNWITNYSVPEEPFDISISRKRDKEETKN